MDVRNSDAVNDLLYEGLGKLSGGWKYQMESQQPKHCSWVTLDAELQNCCVDAGSFIGYKDVGEMKSKVVELVQVAMSEELLEMVRTGEILHLSFRIGPSAISGYNYNEEHGIEEFEYSDKNEKAVQ